MTQASTDYVYAIPPQVPDRNVSPSANDSGASFDDHLSQASSSPTEQYRTNSSSPSRPSPAENGSENLRNSTGRNQQPELAETAPKTNQKERNSGSQDSSVSTAHEPPAK